MTWRSATSSTGEFDPEFHQTCDNCGEPGHSDSGAFVFTDGVVNAAVICRDCQEKRDRKRASAPQGPTS